MPTPNPKPHAYPYPLPPGQVWASIKRDSGAGYAIKVMGRRRVVGKKAESHLLSELHCMQQARG